jgi:hypothetical protein
VKTKVYPGEREYWLKNHMNESMSNNFIFREDAVSKHRALGLRDGYEDSIDRDVNGHVE